MYGENAPDSCRAELWTVVLTMARVIYKELGKVQVDTETAYGSEHPAVMVGQYLWWNL